jgi:hypothetical protein
VNAITARVIIAIFLITLKVVLEVVIVVPKE